MFEHIRPAIPADRLLLIDSTTCKAHRSARGAARSTSNAEALGRSRGGTGSKLQACVDGAGTHATLGAGQVLRLIASPGHHSDLRHALPLVADLPAADLAADRGYVSATFRASLAAVGCTAHTRPSGA